MYNAALVGVVMRDSVVLVFNSFSGAVCGGGNRRLAFAPADYFNTAMEYCYRNAPLILLTFATVCYIMIA